jgi:hypothetical protein
LAVAIHFPRLGPVWSGSQGVAAHRPFLRLKQPINCLAYFEANQPFLFIRTTANPVISFAEERERLLVMPQPVDTK